MIAVFSYLDIPDYGTGEHMTRFRGQYCVRGHVTRVWRLRHSAAVAAKCGVCAAATGGCGAARRWWRPQLQCHACLESSVQCDPASGTHVTSHQACSETRPGAAMHCQ